MPLIAHHYLSYGGTDDASSPAPPTYLLRRAGFYCRIEQLVWRSPSFTGSCESACFYVGARPPECLTPRHTPTVVFFRCETNHVVLPEQEKNCPQYFGLLLPDQGLKSPFN